MEEDHLKNSACDEPTRRLYAAGRNATNTVDALQEQLVEAKRLKRLVEDLIAFQRRQLPLHIKALCEKENDFLKVLRQKNHPAIPAIEELFGEMNARSSEAMRGIPGELEKLAKAEGLAINFSQSQHPKYYFEPGGFIEVEVQDKKMEAKISTREGVITRIPADAAAIIDIVKLEKKRLFERPSAGPRFLSDLRSAYTMALKTRKKVDGDPVPLREIFYVMSRKINTRKSYKSDEFLVDLSRLVVDGPGETKGYRFELQQTKDTQEGMLLLGEAGRGMVNLLIFKKADALNHDR